MQDKENLKVMLLFPVESSDRFFWNYSCYLKKFK